MGLATRAAATAQRLITKFGNAATYKDIDNVYSPPSGSVAPTGSNVAIIMAGPFGINPMLTANSMLEVKDATALIASKDATFTPKVGKTITHDGKDWVIMSVETVRAQDVDIIWKVVIR